MFKVGDYVKVKSHLGDYIGKVTCVDDTYYSLCVKRLNYSCYSWLCEDIVKRLTEISNHKLGRFYE